MKLRISHINIQPVLVWDNDEELSAGPELSQLSLSISKATELLESLPEQVKLLQEKLESK